MILAVDPGIRGCGCALFSSDGALIDAAYVRGVQRVTDVVQAASTVAVAVARWADGRLEDLREVAVEFPQVYASRIRSGESKGDPNDLLGLAAVDGALAGYLDLQVRSYLPRQWKGQMTKEACHHRIKTRLGTPELAIMACVGGPLAHNVWDAVGIGLHHLGRLKPRRVIPV